MIDTTSVARRFMLVVLPQAAEIERNLNRERTKAAIAFKRDEGRRVGTVPYGFDLADDGTTLIPNETEPAVIRDIGAMRATDTTLTGIAANLTEHGIPTKTGKANRWLHSAVAQTLNRTE